MNDGVLCALCCQVLARETAPEFRRVVPFDYSIPSVSALPCGAVQEAAQGLRCVLSFGRNFPSVVALPCGARNCLRGRYEFP